MCDKHALVGSTKLAENKLDALVLHVGIGLVRQMSRDVQAMSGVSITDGVALNMVNDLLAGS